MPTRSEKNRVELEKQKKLVEQVVQAFAQHQSKELESRRDAITAALKRAVEKEIKHALKKGLKNSKVSHLLFAYSIKMSLWQASYFEVTAHYTMVCFSENSSIVTFSF